MVFLVMGFISLVDEIQFMGAEPHVNQTKLCFLVPFWSVDSDRGTTFSLHIGIFYCPKSLGQWSLYEAFVAVVISFQSTCHE